LSSPVIVQSASIYTLAPGHPSVTLPGSVTAGNYLLAFARMRIGVALPTITDTAGNVWVPIWNFGNTGIWYCIAHSTGGITVTAQFDSDSYDGALYVMEISGAASFTSVVTTGDGPTAYAATGPYQVTIQFGASVWLLGLIVFEDAQVPGQTPQALMLALLNSTGGVYFLPVPSVPSGWADAFGSANHDTSAVFDSSGSAATAIDGVILDLCKRAGLDVSRIDVSLLTSANLKPTNICLGYVVERPTPAAELLKILMQAYFFDGCESDGKMKWVPRGLAPALAIPEADLGLLSDGAKLEEHIGQEQDLPQSVTVLYNDPALVYQQGKQHKGRNVRIIRTRNQVIITMPMTLTADWARQIAEKWEYLFWLERFQYTLNLWKAYYMLLDPTDVITFIYEGLGFEMRVVENSLGQGYVVALTGVSENANNYLSSIVGGGIVGGGGTGLQLAPPTLLFLFDIPLLRDMDANPGGTGFYYAMSALLPWSGGVLYDSIDNATFGQKSTSLLAANFGFALDVPAAPRSPWTWDMVHTLTVKMSKGMLASDTRLNVLNGKNALLYGDEVIQFTDAVQNMDGSYTLSGLLRGRRGTEWAISGHAVGDAVVDPYSGVIRVADPLSAVNQLRYYRAVTIGQDVSLVQSDPFTIVGNDDKPYSPVHLAGARDGGNNLTLTWIRRTRIGGPWLDGIGTVPLSEDAELYDVEILDGGGGVLRTIAGLTSPTAPYSAADQTTDFGSPQGSVAIKVYQRSGQVGRGFVAAKAV
jgi:hypothetical protein